MHLPIILFSAQVEEENSLDFCRDDSIQKPFEIKKSKRYRQFPFELATYFSFYCHLCFDFKTSIQMKKILVVHDDIDILNIVEHISLMWLLCANTFNRFRCARYCNALLYLKVKDKKR